MIKLKVAYYCHDCPRFIPKVIERPRLGKPSSYETTYGKAEKSKTFYGDTVIACTDCARCEMVYKSISEAMEEIND